MNRKLNFFLSALLVLLFIMGLNSYSLASEFDYTDFEIPIEFWENLIEYYNNNIGTYSTLSGINPFPQTAESCKNYYDTSFKTTLKDYAESFGATDQNLMILIKSTSDTVNLIFYISNNTIGTVQNSFNFRSAGDFVQTPSSGVSVGMLIRKDGFLKKSQSSNTQNSYWRISQNNFNPETTTYNNGPWFGLNAPSLNVINLQVPGYSNYQNVFINGYYNINPVPEVPEEPTESGDSSGSGTTGIITNPSGDTTGKVDLSGIEQGIGDINNNLENIKEQIPTSGEIKDAQVNASKDFWGNEDDIKSEDFENELENNFNGIMENLSGELTQNEIFKSLQGAENGFLNFFKDEQDENFYDLAFSWPDIEYMGGVIIPSGGINISEMCREIPELSKLQALIRVIFNFTVAVCLVKQIYNLILSTLGIDNPYLYEDYDESTFINEDTGEYTQKLVKRKRIYRR